MTMLAAMDVTDIQTAFGEEKPVFPMCMECMLVDKWPDAKNVESAYVFCRDHCTIRIEEIGTRVVVYVTPKGE